MVSGFSSAQFASAEMKASGLKVEGQSSVSVKPMETYCKTMQLYVWSRKAFQQHDSGSQREHFTLDLWHAKMSKGMFVLLRFVTT